jgi:hypothetical protein
MAAMLGNNLARECWSESDINVYMRAGRTRLRILDDHRTFHNNRALYDYGAFHDNRLFCMVVIVLMMMLMAVLFMLMVLLPAFMLPGIRSNYQGTERHEDRKKSRAERL